MNKITKKDGIFYWNGLEHELKSWLFNATGYEMIHTEWDDKGCHFVLPDKRELLIWHCRNNTGFLTVMHTFNGFTDHLKIYSALDAQIKQNEVEVEVEVPGGTMDELRKHAEEDIQQDENPINKCTSAGEHICKCANNKTISKYVPKNIKDAVRSIENYLNEKDCPDACLNQAIAFLEYERNFLSDLDEIKNKRLHAERQFDFYDRLLKRCLRER